MKTSKSLKLVLILGGLIAVAIGAAQLLIPIAFHATSGITLGSDINLLSEIRAPGGALLAFGFLIMAGAFIARLSFTSIVVSTLLYMSYGLARILGILLDGMPDMSLLLACALEILIGLISAYFLINHQQPDKLSQP